MDAVTTLQELAAQVRAQFEQGTRRDNGADFWKRKDEHRGSDWVQAMCMAAHADMMPDDVKYEYIVDALDCIAENGDDDDRSREWIDGATDIYNSDLTSWLASHNGRAEYVDRAARDGMIEADADTWKRLQVGQYLEREDVYAAVLSALRGQVDA